MLTEHARTLVARCGASARTRRLPCRNPVLRRTTVPRRNVVYAETYLSRLMTWNTQRGAEVLVTTGGGPNAALVGTDGRVYYTQNGGQAGEWRAADQRPPAVIAFDPVTGESETLCTDVAGRPLLAPHDLTWGPDGRLFATDSGTWAPGGATEPGAIIAIGRSAVELIHDTGHVFPSGIAFDANGRLYWAECYTGRIMRRATTTSPTEVWAITPPGHTPESLAFDEHGRVWVAALEAGGFDVYTPNGTWESFVTTGGLPLNGVLHDGALIVTDLGDYDDALPRSADHRKTPVHRDRGGPAPGFTFPGSSPKAAPDDPGIHRLRPDGTPPLDVHACIVGAEGNAAAHAAEQHLVEHIVAFA